MRRGCVSKLATGFAFCGIAAACASAQMAKGANKFLGSITTSGSVRAGYLAYWNQITGENEHKWGTVEGTRNTMNWTGGDRIRDFAEKNGIPWKFHTLVWGAQYPAWMTSLSQADQLEEITEWFDAAKARYPDVPMIDVVNEAYEANGGKHAPVPFKDALGGAGSTGFDYIVTAFKMARERWPNAVLIYNDYNTLEWTNEINWVKTTIPKLVAAGAPIDAIGFQAHGLKYTSASTLKTRLDDIWNATRLPFFITGYDIGDANDSTQKATIADQFAVMWNHPKIVGITYWGYIVGKTWIDGTGLMSDANVERPSLVWMKEFVANNPNPPNEYPELASRILGRALGVEARDPTPARVRSGLVMKDLDGRLKMGIERDGRFLAIDGRHGGR